MEQRMFFMLCVTVTLVQGAIENYFMDNSFDNCNFNRVHDLWQGDSALVKAWYNPMIRSKVLDRRCILSFRARAHEGEVGKLRFRFKAFDIDCASNVTLEAYEGLFSPSAKHLLSSVECGSTVVDDVTTVTDKAVIIIDREDSYDPSKYDFEIEITPIITKDPKCRGWWFNKC